MGIMVLRRATAEDNERVEQAAVRFCKRHNIERKLYGEALSAWDDVEDWLYYLQPPDQGYYRSLWRQCFRRAVKHPTVDTIAHGYVGWAHNNT